MEGFGNDSNELHSFLKSIDLEIIESKLVDKGYLRVADLLWLHPNDIQELFELNIDWTHAQMIRFKNSILKHENYQHRHLLPQLQQLQQSQQSQSSQPSTLPSYNNNTNNKTKDNIKMQTKPSLKPLPSNSTDIYADLRSIVNSKIPLTTDEGPSKDTNIHVTSTYDNNITTNDDTTTNEEWKLSGWWILITLITLGGQGYMTYIIILDMIDIFSNIGNYKLWGESEDGWGEVVGIFAVGQQARGIVCIGQICHGVFCLGQVNYGLFTIGQVGVGLIWTFCQAGGGLGWGMFQVGVATYVKCCQLGSGLWKTVKAQIGFSVLAPVYGKSKFIVTCGGD